MHNTYQRRQPVSRLERLLARLLRGQPRPSRSTPQVDLVLDVEANFPHDH